MNLRKCSTWNNLIRRVAGVFSAFVVTIASISSTAFAGAVAVPVSAELIAQLLVALGLMVGNETDGYLWANDNPYVTSIFEQQVSVITSDIPIAGETLEPLLGTVVPTDVYTTDGTNFYVGEKKVTADDVYLQARALTTASYYMPTNLTGLIPATVYSPSNGGRRRCRVTTPVGDVGSNNYFVPYYTTDGFASYVTGSAFSIISGSDTVNPSSARYRFIGADNLPAGDEGTYGGKVPIDTYVQWALPDTSSSSNVVFLSTDTAEPYNLPSSNYFVVLQNPIIYRASGIDQYKNSSITGASLLQTSGVPVVTLPGNATDLGSAVVKVEKPSDDDPNDDKPPVPVSPNSWELWRSFEDLIRFVDSGEVTNGGTNYEQYVNNNYNYVDVDINVPDEINNNVNLSGGLDISGSGDVNITIHEDVSLPSAGDGSGFFTPDATDAIGAIAKDNPVYGVVSGVFSAIDPAILGIFTASVSLLLVLGIWKLIRG